MSDTNPLHSKYEWERLGLIYIPAEIDSKKDLDMNRMIRLRICYSDLTGKYVSISEIISTISTVPKKFLLGFVRNVSVALDRDHFSNCSSQLGIAKLFTVGELGDRVIEEVEKANKIFICPRTLAAIAKLALAYSSDIPDIDELTFKSTMMNLCLSLADYMDGKFPDVMQESDINKREILFHQGILQWLVQMSDLTSPNEFVESISRIWAVLHVIPQSDPYKQLKPEPNILFETQNGISLAEAMALSESVAFRYQLIDFSSPSSIWSNLVIEENCFSGTKLDAARSLKYFNTMILSAEITPQLKMNNPAIIKTPADMENSKDKTYFLDFSILKKYPLLEIAENSLFPLYYPFFRWRITEGLYWEIFSCANKIHKNKTFQSNFGQYFESYVQSFFKTAFPTTNFLPQRIWMGKELKKNESDPAADIVIQYPNSYVFIEIKSARFKYLQSILSGDPDAIKDDLRIALFEPSEQLSSAIDFFCDKKLELDGQKWNGEKFYPVIITYGIFPSINPVWKTLKSEVHEKGWLNKPHIHDLLVINSFESTLLANLAFHGVSLVDVIKQKTSPEHDGVTFQTFCYEKYTTLARPREVIKHYWDSFSDYIRTLLFKKP